MCFEKFLWRSAHFRIVLIIHSKIFQFQPSSHKQDSINNSLNFTGRGKKAQLRQALADLIPHLTTKLIQELHIRMWPLVGAGQFDDETKTVPGFVRLLIDRLHEPHSRDLIKFFGLLKEKRLNPSCLTMLVLLGEWVVLFAIVCECLCVRLDKCCVCVDTCAWLLEGKGRSACTGWYVCTVLYVCLT